MRLPPPLATALPSTQRWCNAVHAFTALCIASLVAWASVRLQHGQGVCIASSAAAALIAAFASRAVGESPDSRRLEWNGERWLLREASGSFEFGAVDIALDLDDWLLLRFRSDRRGRIATARVRWLPLRAGKLPDSGSALRAALIGAAATNAVSR